MKTRCLVKFFLLSVLSFQSFANDAASAIGAGGLQPKKNTRVIMESEKLHIDPRQITVDYVFFNPTDRDEETTVAFPLPDINVFLMEENIEALRSTGKKDPADLVGFSVEVEGKKIPFKTEQKAQLKEKDVTPLLAKLRLPIIPWFPEPESYRKALRRLTQTQKEEIMKAGLLLEGQFPVGEDPDPSFQYVVKTQYYWQQIFPKKTRVRVHHHYVPMTGFSYGPTLSEDLCASKDEALKKELNKLNPYCWRELRYILTTANTWKGPIGDFQLTLARMPYVNTCFKGIAKRHEGKWVFSAKNYQPTEDLYIGFCAPAMPRKAPDPD